MTFPRHFSRTLFASLSIRNYRLFASGQLVSLTGTWMQRFAQDWLVLTMPHGGGFAVGVTTGLQFLPQLLLGLYGGTLADRYDKRKLLIATQTAMGFTALVLGLLDVAGVVSIWHVFALAFALGVASAVDVPTRQAFVSELVGRDQLPNAIGLNSATFNSARVLGPVMAGLLVARLGTGPVFLVNAASFIAVLAGLAMMRPGELHRGEPVARAKGQTRDGLRYVARRPDLLLPIVLAGVIGTFGFNFQMSSAMLVKETFHRDAVGYGVLSSLIAIGALGGALMAAGRRRISPRMLVGSALAFGLLEAAAGMMPSYVLFAIVLVPMGFASLTFTTAANSAVQLGTSRAMRGRVMALYVLVFLGGTPIGAPIIGWVGETFSPRACFVVGGLLSAAAAALAGAWFTRARRHEAAVIGSLPATGGSAIEAPAPDAIPEVRSA